MIMTKSLFNSLTYIQYNDNIKRTINRTTNEMATMIHGNYHTLYSSPYTRCMPTHNT